MACRASGLDAFARVPPTDYATVMRPLETGCSGVMVAQVRTLDEVQRAVQWSKYPPRGTRGLFLGNAECDYGNIPAAEHVARANAQALAGHSNRDNRSPGPGCSHRSDRGRGLVVRWPSRPGLLAGCPGTVAASAMRRGTRTGQRGVSGGRQTLGHFDPRSGSRGQMPRSRLPALQSVQRSGSHPARDPRLARDVRGTLRQGLVRLSDQATNHLTVWRRRRATRARPNRPIKVSKTELGSGTTLTAAGGSPSS